MDNVKIPPTARQLELLNIMRRHLDEKGYMPSYEVMAKEMGVKSKSLIARTLDRLQDRGHVRRTPGQRGAIVLL